MPLYTALLRGINVGGHRRIPMEKLRAIIAACTFEDVRTYIQSGNVVFRAPETDEAMLRQTIEAGIEENMGFPVEVFLRSGAEMRRIAARDPFAGRPLEPEDTIFVTFLHEPPAGTWPAEEDILTEGREIYTFTRRVNGERPFPLTHTQATRKVSVTTRNWATVTKLAEMCEGCC
jgi:uncharacterized protein (DUF1697 family)